MRKFLCLLLWAASLATPSLSHGALESRFVEPDPGLLEEIRELFPEGREVAPRLLDFQVDPNLYLHREAEIEVTFLWEVAGFQNSFGYFLYRDADGDGRISEGEITLRKILWENASQVGSGGELRSGDTLVLGKFPAGTRMGFFLEANGFRRSYATYFTLDHLNPDGRRHLAMTATADRKQIVLGIEDLPWEGSDRDFNDLMFTLRADPWEALEEAIDSGNIPVQREPEPAPPSPDLPESPEKIVGVPEPTLETAASAPAYLEGSGLGCRLSPTSQETVERYAWCLQWAGLAYLYFKRRGRMP